jgi:hypothetical protein
MVGGAQTRNARADRAGGNQWPLVGTPAAGPGATGSAGDRAPLSAVRIVARAWNTPK